MNPSSTEDYLDSLLRAVQQKETPIADEEEIVETQTVEEEVLPENSDLQEEAEVSEILELPEEEALPEILELPEENLPEILELPEEEDLPEILELLEEEDLPEILELPEEENLPEILELPEEALPEILELPEEEDIPEVLELPTEDTTLLDLFLDDPNKALSPEEIQAMFAQAEETLAESIEEAEKLPVELVEEAETLSVEDVEEIPDVIGTDEISFGGIELDDELPPLEEVLGRLAAEEAVDLSLSDVQNEENLEEEPSVLTGEEMYADEIQNLSEDDIMSLLQKSSEIEFETDSDMDMFSGDFPEKADLNTLLENMNEDSDIAGLQDLFEKSENNEPVSSEVEEMIELGLQLPDEETPIELEVVQEPKQGFFGKLKNKLFSKKSKKEKDSDIAVEENSELHEEPIVVSNPEEFLFDETPDVESADLNALFDFGAGSDFGTVNDFADSVDSAEGTDALKDLMAETGGLFFDGVSENATESFSFDQLFEDTSNMQSDNSEAADISDLLKSLESAEGQSDIFAAGDDLFPDMDSEKGIETIGDLLEGAEEELKKEKKPGLFSRLFTFLTAEDEEDDSVELSKEGVENLGVTSEENKEAMDQLDKEGDDKKKKKKKDKKGKKGEPAEDDLDEDDEPQDDKKKKKKVKKEKKQKEPKPVEDFNEPVLSKKKVRSTFLFAFTIMAAILVCCIFVPELFEKKSARNAFYDGDYETCYQAFYGKKLSESDSLIFEKAGFMLALERRVDSYDNYMAVGDELRALESLMQEVEKQDEVLRNAQEYELEAEAEQSYLEVLQILSERYQVSEEDAHTINAYKQDALFTLHLKAIVEGEEFVCPDYLREDGQDAAGNDVVVEDSGVVETEQTLEDLLPAEEELTETEFEEGTN